MTNHERPRALEGGDILDGRYEVMRELGRGAAGAVYEARHLFTGRFVAVKLLLPHHHPLDAEELRARLQREARALASIRHPGIVDVLDGGVAMDGSPYVVMEMLNGRTLEGLIAARGTVSTSNTIGVAVQLCDALHAVHLAGVVHRDVKPTNIIVTRDNTGSENIKLVDFGIARLVEPSEEKITAQGAPIGTPGYMSPERLLGVEALDGASDVYSVGVMMFECLSGSMPYTGTYGQVLMQASSSTPAPSLRSVAPDVPGALSDVVHRAMAKRVSDRFQTAGDLAAALLSLPGASPRTTLLGPPPLPASVGAAQAGAQRRQWRRAPYSTPLQLLLESGGIDGRSEDISEAGLLVVSRESCATGQRAVVRFALPMEGKVVSVDAQVRWVRAAHSRHAIGLEFPAPPAYVRMSIARYVDLMSERT